MGEAYRASSPFHFCWGLFSSAPVTTALSPRPPAKCQEEGPEVPSRKRRGGARFKDARAARGLQTAGEPYVRRDGALPRPEPGPKGLQPEGSAVTATSPGRAAPPRAAPRTWAVPAHSFASLALPSRSRFISLRSFGSATTQAPFPDRPGPLSLTLGTPRAPSQASPRGGPGPPSPGPISCKEKCRLRR